MTPHLSYANVVRAADEIRSHVHQTPVFTCNLIDELLGASLFFKCENLQKAGAFKARGAVNAVFNLDAQSLERGVATHSSGNHGAALARAAQIRGVPAYIVVPENARQVKLDAIASYGGEITTCTPTLAAREATLRSVIARTGATEIHPYDNPDIICGQGTAGLELVEQVSRLDAMIVPVGGGGLLAGCGLVAAKTGITIYGAEPQMADDAHRSFHTGERVTQHSPQTMCDGLQTTLGAANFSIIQRTVKDILLCSEAEITEAMRLIWSRMKLVVEPSSAIVLAAAIRNRSLFTGRRVGLILTGGNVDLANLPF